MQNKNTNNKLPLKKMISSLLCGLAMSVVVNPVSANHLEHVNRGHQERHYQTLSPYLGIGIGFGGDEIGRFVDSDGDLDKVRSGGGWLLEGGLSLAVDPSTSLRLTTGYQFDIASRLNGDSLFDRLRFDLFMLRSFDAHQFGAGITAHTSVGYSCTINSICEGDVEFDHAIGYTLEYSVKVANYQSYNRSRRSDSTRGMSLGVRYTGIDYRARLNDQFELTDGDTLTGFIGIVF